VTGEVLLSKPERSWDEFLDWVQMLDLSARLPGKA